MGTYTQEDELYHVGKQQSTPDSVWLAYDQPGVFCRILRFSVGCRSPPPPFQFTRQPLYSQNYYRIVKEKNRTYYEVYSLPRTETPPEDYTQVSFVYLRPDGAYEAPATVSSVCRYSRKKIGDMDDFHFHLLRHTYTTNLLSHGAAPKDVQELLGHSDVSTTMNIYAHATREAKRTSARLLDKVVGTA